MVNKSTASKRVRPLPTAAALEAVRQDSLSTYRRVTDIIWQRLSPTFGIRTINAIARSVIVREQGKHPLLGHLGVNDSGLDWSEFERRAQAVTPRSMQQSIDCFINAYFEALANMIGHIVVSKLFNDAEGTAIEEARP
ncbi:MAG: hypothetical protein HY898_03230 [Deltaproteobacteria bacterium]|nr:hypothetical protein [Deltaproteobacteria bacterium]